MTDWDTLVFLFQFPETYLLVGLYGLLTYRGYRRLRRYPYRNLVRAAAAGLAFWLLFFAGLGAVLFISLIAVMFHVAAVVKQPI